MDRLETCPTYHLINTPELFEDFLAQLREQKSFSFDTETTDIRPRFAELVGLSFAWNDREAWYLPVRGPGGEPHLDLHETLDALRPILENPAIEKIGQNLKYDILVLRGAGVELQGHGLRFDDRRLPARCRPPRPQSRRSGVVLPRP